MLKKLMALAAMAALTGPAEAATYVVLPSAGSMAPPTVIVDGGAPRNLVFVCSSLTEIAAGTCRLHRSR